MVYGCQIVVTNPTSSRQKLNVLLQMPLGAMPVLNRQYTKSVHLDLEPYHTQTLEYHFYFPAAGKFAHYPGACGEERAAAGLRRAVHAQRGRQADQDRHGIVGLHLAARHERARCSRILASRTSCASTWTASPCGCRTRRSSTGDRRCSPPARVQPRRSGRTAIMHNAAGGDPRVPAARRRFVSAVRRCTGQPAADDRSGGCGSYEHLEYKPLVNARRTSWASAGRS